VAIEESADFVLATGTHLGDAVLAAGLGVTAGWQGPAFQFSFCGASQLKIVQFTAQH
jgi:hypothetical protein